jgi:hypothetical protein
LSPPFYPSQKSVYFLLPPRALPTGYFVALIWTLSTADLHAKVREEMADVLLYLIRLADKLKVDLLAACPVIL